jgi:hypothetical protein
MHEYTTETQAPYTGATQRLEAPAAYLAASTAAPPSLFSRLDPSVIAVCVFALLIIIAISRAPQSAPVPASVDQHVEVFSRNCIGYCP